VTVSRTKNSIIQTSDTGFDRKNRSVFGRISGEYEKFREGYPKQIFVDVVSFANISAKSEVLEVGCGSGKATLPFAKLGCHITGLDINPELIAMASSKTSQFKNVEYINSSFETADLATGSFDMVFAAQAWHWVEPNIGYDKVSKLLKENGMFTVFWKSQDRESKLRRDLQTLYIKYCPNYSDYTHDGSLIIKRVSETGSFEEPLKKEYNTNKEFTKAEFLGLVATYSWVAILEEATRQLLFTDISKLIKDIEEPIVMPYTYVLLMFRKTK
jgi:ubiquinone/menaquinone biosynthesis C-methylase UbiE